jgi:hypothetical protein
MPSLENHRANSGPCGSAVMSNRQRLVGGEASPHGKLLHHQDKHRKINLSGIRKHHKIDDLDMEMFIPSLTLV